MQPTSVDAAAWASWARGDVDAAVRHALDIRADHPERERMLRLASTFALRAHRVDLLDGHLDEIQALPHGTERDAVVATSRLGQGDLSGAVALALALAEDDDAAERDERLPSAAVLRAATIAHVGLGALASGAWTTARQCVDAASRLLPHDSDGVDEEATRFDLLAIASVAEAHTDRGEVALRALNDAIAPLRARNLLTSRHALALLCLGDVEHLRGDLGRAAVDLTRGLRLVPSERPGLIAHARISLAFIRIRQGRWADAADTVDALDIPRDTIERGWIETQVLAVRGLLRAVEGDLPASVELLGRAREMSERTPSYLASIVLLHAQISATIGRGDWRGLRRALDDAEEPGYRHPYRTGEWNALTLLAAWHVGDLTTFRRRLSDWAQAGDTAFDAYYWAFVAILAEHEKRYSDGLVAVERALVSIGHDDDPLGRTWVRMVAGTYLGRFGTNGAPDPARALAVYDAAVRELRELGAHAFAARCEAIVADTTAELERARDARPSTALTEQQVRIARAVAQGYTSDEIAAIEYLSKRTIDYHVANILKRLGVTSRREIARVLDGEG